MEVSPSIRSSVVDSVNSSMRSPTWALGHGIFKRPDIIPSSTEFQARHSFYSDKSEDNIRITPSRNLSPYRTHSTPKLYKKERIHIRSPSPKFNLEEKAQQDKAEDHAEVLEYRREFNNLESENRKLRNQIKLLNNEITLEREDKIALKNHYRTQERTFIERIQQLEEELRKFKIDTMKDITRNENLEVSLTEIKKHKNELIDENSFLKHENKTIKHEMADAIRKLQRDLELLANENEALKYKCESLTSSHDVYVNSKIQLLEKELEDQRNLNKKLRWESEEITQRLRNELSEQKSTMQDISTEKAKLMKHNKANYEGVVKTLESKLKDLETRYNQTLHDNEELKHQLNTIKLSSKISEADEDREHKFVAFEKQITTNNRKIDELESQLTQANSKYAQLQSKIAQSRKSHDDIVPSHSRSESNIRPSPSKMRKGKRPVKPTRQSTSGYNSEADGHRHCDACYKLKIGLDELLKNR
jgi:predicted  nucleic acid-binding Zn-ribbon protein